MKEVFNGIEDGLGEGLTGSKADLMLMMSDLPDDVKQEFASALIKDYFYIEGCDGVAPLEK